MPNPNGRTHESRHTYEPIHDDRDHRSRSMMQHDQDREHDRRSRDDSRDFGGDRYGRSDRGDYRSDRGRDEGRDFGGRNVGGTYGREYGGDRYGRSDDRHLGSRRDYGHDDDYGRSFSGYERGDYGRGDNERTDFGHSTMRRDFGPTYGDQPRSGSIDQDQKRWGGMRGKGPSSYTRSDDRIKEDVCQLLTDHDEIDATNIDVAVKNGEVTLSGTVDDRRAKRLAEDCVEHCSGVKDVQNHIRIKDQKDPMTPEKKARMS